jgi:hypothetical protein
MNANQVRSCPDSRACRDGRVSKIGLTEEMLRDEARMHCKGVSQSVITVSRWIQLCLPGIPWTPLPPVKELTQNTGVCRMTRTTVLPECRLA